MAKKKTARKMAAKRSKAVNTGRRKPVKRRQWMITKNGIYFLENLNLEELAADKAYEFAFVFAPLKLKGASGSPGNPIAVR
jgi:kynurenine formamidase